MMDPIPSRGANLQPSFTSTVSTFAATSTDTQSWPPGWEPPFVPPPLSEQLVRAFIALHISAVRLKEAWS